MCGTLLVRCLLCIISIKALGRSIPSQICGKPFHHFDVYLVCVFSPRVSSPKPCKKIKWSILYETRKAFERITILYPFLIQVILEDLKLLDIQPDLFTHTSDHFDRMITIAEDLIKSSKAYVDDTDPEEMKRQRDLREESKNRNNC